MPTTSFYVAESLTVPGHYVSGLDQNQQPTYSSDLNDAQWSDYSKVIQDYIDLYAINAKPKEQTGGVRPPRPPVY